MNVYIRLAEHVKKRRYNFHSGSSVDVFSTSAKTSRRLLDVTLPSGRAFIGPFYDRMTLLATEMPSKV